MQQAVWDGGHPVWSESSIALPLVASITHFGDVQPLFVSHTRQSSLHSREAEEREGGRGTEGGREREGQREGGRGRKGEGGRGRDRGREGEGGTEGGREREGQRDRGGREEGGREEE